MKWIYYRAGLYTEKKRSHWLKQWPIRKGLVDKKGELSLVEDVIWTSSKRWTGQPMESSRGLGDLQGVNEFFLFAEKRIQRFDESRGKKTLITMSEHLQLQFLHEVDKLTSRKYAETINLLFAGNKLFVTCQTKVGG